MTNRFSTKNHTLFFILALVVLVFAALGLFFSGHFNWFVITHLILGFGFLSISIFLAFRKNSFRILSSRSANSSGSTLKEIIVALILILLLGLFNYWAAVSQLSWDVTEQKIHGLSSETRTLLRELDAQLEIFIVTQNQVAKTHRLSTLAELYQQEKKDLIKVQELDPLQQPRLASQLLLKKGIQAVVRYDNNQLLHFVRFYEPQMSAALTRLIRKEFKEVAYLNQFSSARIEDLEAEGIKLFVEALERQQVRIKDFDVNKYTEIPETIKAVLLVAPKFNLDAQVIDLIKRYQSKGGGLIVFAEPESGAFINNLLHPSGISVEHAVALDYEAGDHPSQEVSWQMQLKEFPQNSISSGLTKADQITLVYAAPLKLSDSLLRSRQLKPLLITGARAWGETDLANLNSATPQAVYDPLEDLTGPLVLAASIQQENLGRTVVFGDSAWIRNHNLNFYSNARLAVNSVLWTLGEQAHSNYSERWFKPTQLLLSSGQFKQLLLLACLLPEVLLLLGLYIWWRRTYSSSQKVCN